MSEFTKLGGYLIEGQPEVAHDNTLSGNGLEGSPLGLSEQVSEVNDLVHSNSGTWNGVSTKLDTTAFSDVSGTFLTAHQDLSDYQTTAGMTAYQPVGNYQTAGDYLTTADSANFYTTANESGFITGVDLTPYQLTADMTAYQPTGDYLTTADSANFYTTANESGFISEVPAGTMNESAFGYDASDNITGYNGSAFKAGDEFPQSATEAIETVTANSADWNGTTETVSSNSGVWGGSALPISAGPGIKLELVNNTLLASTQGPILDEITIAGTWNGREVKQMLLTGTFSTNVNSDVIPVNSAYSAYERKWIDPSNSFIFYGSSANILPSTWVLGATERLGSLSLLNGIVRARSNDTTQTNCTAFVTIKWC